MILMMGSSWPVGLLWKIMLKASMAVQWLRLLASSGGEVGLVPDWSTKIPYAMWYRQNKERKEKKN